LRSKLKSNPGNYLEDKGRFSPNGIPHAFDAFDAFDADGNSLAWDPQADLPAQAMLPDGDRMYLVGAFSGLNGVVRSRYAVVDAQGTGNIVQ